MAAPEKIRLALLKLARQVKRPSDGVVFSSETIATSVIQTNADYSGVQVKLRGQIGRSLLHLLPDSPAPNVLAYTIDSVVAEKVDAMLRLGLLNTRMKDFHDVWHLSNHIDFSLSHLTTHT